MRKLILLLTTAFIIAVSSLPGVAFADTDVDINEISLEKFFSQKFDAAFIDAQKSQY